MTALLTSNLFLAGLLGLAAVLAFLAHESVIGAVTGGLAVMAVVAREVRDEHV